MVKADILKKARQYELKGNYNAAIEEYKKVIAENPNDASIYNMLGDLYAKSGAVDEALKSYAEAARIYESQELYEYAIAILKKAKRVMPKDRYVYFKLADLYLKQEMIRESEEVIREYVEKVRAGEIFINKEQLYHDLEYILKNFAKDEEMLQIITSIVEEKLKDKSGFYEKLLINIAEKYEQLGKIDRAQELYKKIPKDSPFYKKIKVKLAISSTVDKETLNEAIKELKQRIVESNGTINDYRELITLLEKKGDLEEASKYYTELAELYYRSGDLKNALQSLLNALDKDPNNSRALEVLARMIQERPELQSREYAHYLVDLANRYLELGKVDEAINYLRMAAETGYDRESLISFMKMLQECKTLLSIKFRGMPLIKRMKNYQGEDPVTGFMNPCQFFSVANEEMARAMRRNETLTFAILNIEGFQSFIESYGEDIATNVIQTIGLEIKSRLGDDIEKGNVFVTRLYQDVFLFLHKSPCFKLKKYLEQLVDVIEKKESILGDYYEIKLEAGLIEYPKEAGDFRDVLKRLEFVLTEISLRAGTHRRDVSSRVVCLSSLSQERQEYHIPEFVNRENELNTLLDIYETVSGKGVEKIVFIRGPVGIGKTTLLEEFLNKIQGDKNTWIFKTNLSATQTPATASAIVGLIRDFIQDPTNLELLSSIDEVPPVIAETIPQLAKNAIPEEELDEDERKLRLIGWLEKLVEMFVEAGTIVIAIDDLEYIDDLSYTVLTHLVATYKWARILFVGTYSTESLSEKEKVESTFDYFEKSNLLNIIDLKPFTREKVREYIEDFLLTTSIPDELIEFVIKETSAIPLFMKELLKSLIENGELRKKGGKWVWEGKGDVKFTPEIEKIFERKIQKISDDILFILGIASTLGTTFSSSDIVKVIKKNSAFKYSGDDIDSYVKKNLELSAQNGFIRKLKETEEGEVVYQFINESIKNFVRKKLHQRQTDEALRKIYQTSASVLEEKMLYGEKDLMPDVALNYLRAGIYDKALYYLISSGQWAEVNGSIKDALKFYDMALDAYNKLKETEKALPVHESIYLRILENKARINIVLSRFAEAERDVREILSQNVDQTDRARYINLLAEIKYAAGNLSEADKVFHLAITEAQKARNILEEGRAHLFKARIYIDLGKLSAATEEIKKATKLLSSTHAYDELIDIYLVTGVFYLQMAKLDKAEKYFVEGYRIAKSRSRIRQKILAVIYGAKIKRLRGDLELAFAMLSQAMDEAKKLLDPTLIGLILKEEAMCYFFTGDMKNAIFRLENAQSRLSSAPNSLHFLEVNLYMALIYIVGGSYTKAFKTITELQKYLNRCESFPIKLKAYAIRALLDLIFLNPFGSLKIINDYLLKAFKNPQPLREPAPFVFNIISTILFDLENYGMNKKVLKISSEYTKPFPICNCIREIITAINDLMLGHVTIDDKDLYVTYKSIIQTLAFPKMHYLEYTALLSNRAGDIEKCKKRFQDLIEFSESNGYFFYAQRQLLHFGKCLFDNKKYQDALKTFQELLSLLKISNSLFFESLAYFYMMKSYLAMGNKEKAAEIRDKFTGLIENLEKRGERLEDIDEYYKNAPIIQEFVEFKKILSNL